MSGAGKRVHEAGASSGIGRASALLLPLLLLVAPAGATEQPLTGSKLACQNPNGDPLRRKLVVVAGDGPGSPITLGGDPALGGATLRIVTTGGAAANQTFVLPMSGWSTLTGARFRYTNGEVGGAVKSVVLKRSQTGVVRLKLTVRGRDGVVDVVPPAPGETAVAVLTIAGGDTYCASFGGAAGGIERRDDAEVWLVRDAAAVPCPSSSTTTTTETSSSTSTTTPPTTSSSSSSSTSTTTSTSSTSSSTSTTTSTSSTTTTSLVVELNLLYVHGLKSCASSRQNAENSIDELETAVNAALPARIASWEASHPGKHLAVQSARANVYTAPPSGMHPSDSSDPLNMDDWEIGDPGCSATQQGDPCTTAYEWRFRLAEEVNRLYPAPTKNVILIGHSNGARAAMEVTANLGTGGVGTHDWGVQSRIAGVITLHGVIDDIGSSKYDVVGISSFESSCKFGDAISGFGDSCAAGNGFCEWVARVDASPAADWVASNKRALMLTSWGSCSPSAWSGRNDGSLPYDAQASPLAIGLDMTPAPGETWREAHGQRYGAFCHSDLTDPSKTNHVAARTAARDRILDWLFVAAPRVAASGSNATASLGFNQSTATFAMGASCAAGEVDDTITQGTKGAGIDVVGVCRHPGFFDGDDHAITLPEFTVTNGSTCNGTYRWTQAHDSDNNHAATFWWRTRSLRASGPDLAGTLPPD